MSEPCASPASHPERSVVLNAEQRMHWGFPGRERSILVVLGSSCTAEAWAVCS